MQFLVGVSIIFCLSFTIALIQWMNGQRSKLSSIRRRFTFSPGTIMFKAICIVKRKPRSDLQPDTVTIVSTWKILELVLFPLLQRMPCGQKLNTCWQTTALLQLQARIKREGWSCCTVLQSSLCAKLENVCNSTCCHGKLTNTIMQPYTGSHWGQP